MYDAWLSLGCNEVLNQARAYGYSRSVNCPVQWLKCDACDDLGQALGDEVYDIANIDQAPWYDAENPATARFYGAYPITVVGIDDSTREGTITEGIRDGGVIAGHRHAVRTVRVRALILGEGLDALEAGRSWLDAVLEPDECSMHGGSCGQADAQFFAACPPSLSDFEGGVEVPQPPVEQWDMVGTNLATNPSLETTGAVAVVRQNLVPNPLAVSGGGGFVVAGSPTLPTQSFITDFPGATTTAARATVGAGGVTGLFGPLVQLTASVPYSIQMKVRVSAPVTGIDMRVRPGGVGATAGEVIFATNLTDLPVGVSTITATGTTSATAPIASAAVGLRWSTAAAGTTIDITEIQITLSTTPRPFFSGASPASGDFTYAWAGTVNNSASNQRGLSVVGTTPFNAQIISSSEWAASGTHSARVIPNHSSSNQSRAVIVPAFAVLPGEVYTVLATFRLAAPLTGTLWANALKLSASIPGSADNLPYSPATANTAGEHPMRWVITVPAGATTMDIRANAGAANGQGDLWVDNVVVIAGDYSGPFFDGSTTDTADDRYAWTGAANASTSTHEHRALIPQPPIFVPEYPDPIAAFAAAAEALVRTMHGVVCISGPTVQQDLHREDTFGQIVEFVLAAETPFIFGPQRTLSVPPVTPVLVQDDPVNLAKYPSAELQDVATVVAATNYTLNPSLELSTAVPAWTGAVSAVSGSAPAAYFTAVRGTTSSSPPFLTSNGVASFRARILGNGSTAASGVAEIRIANTTALATVANLRVSVNLWVAAQRVSGTAQLISVTVIVEWLDAANAIVGTTTIDSATDVADFDGKSYSAKGLAVPATATQARTVAVVRTNWASSATAASNSDIRIYADANSVTVP